MTPADLAAVIRAALIAVLAERGADTSVVPETVTVERPRNPEHGDYATNVALQLAKKAGMPPRQFAEIVADLIPAAGVPAAVARIEDLEVEAVAERIRADLARRPGERRIAMARERTKGAREAVKAAERAVKAAGIDPPKTSDAVPTAAAVRRSQGTR